MCKCSLCSMFQALSMRCRPKKISFSSLAFPSFGHSGFCSFPESFHILFTACDLWQGTKYLSFLQYKMDIVAMDTLYDFWWVYSKGDSSNIFLHSVSFAFGESSHSLGHSFSACGTMWCQRFNWGFLNAKNVVLPLVLLPRLKFYEAEIT